MIDKIISKKVLREQYEGNEMTVIEIAKSYGMSVVALYKLLDKAGIPKKEKRQLKKDRVNPILVD